MPGRLVILSDLHLGRSSGAARSAEALRPLWRGADRLVVNGDVAEVHHPRYQVAAAREALRLAELCEDDEVELTILSGNHDPFISDLRHLHLADERVFVTHGDALHPAVSPWSPAASRMRRTYERAIEARAPAERERLESILEASQHASFAEWEHVESLESEARQTTCLGMLRRPLAVARVLHYWQTIPGLAASFARVHAPRARFVVIGHTHRPGIWRRNDRLVINTGSYGFPGHARAVVVEHDAISVWPVRQRRPAYALAPSPVARFTLGADEPLDDPVAPSAAPATV